MPGHTINKLLTPPDFLQHTLVPHVEKSSHACRKTSDHLHAVESVIDYSVKEPRISTQISHNLFKILWKYGLSFKNMPDVFRKLDQEKHGREINGAGTNMALLFQFANMNQEQVLSVHS